LGFTPRSFRLGAAALQAKLSGKPPGTECSLGGHQFQPMETYILKTLDEKSRVMLKLGNPLGVGERLAASYLKLAQNRLALLPKTERPSRTYERQLDVYRDDMQNDFSLPPGRH